MTIRKLVTNSLANNSITAAKIAPGAVTVADVADGVVTAAKLANNSVTTDKVVDNAITADKLANTLDLSSKSVTVNVTLPDNSVTEQQLAANLDFSNTVVDLRTGEVSATELANTLDLSSKTITLPANSITGSMLVDTIDFSTKSSILFPPSIEIDGAQQTFKVDGVNNRVGVGTLTPSTKLEVDGTFLVSGVSTFNSNAHILGTSLNANSATVYATHLELSGDITANSITTTNYRNGEVLQHIVAYAKGGTYNGVTFENVTAAQTPGTSHVKINGTLINNYIPPAGTTAVVIKAHVMCDNVDTDEIWHVKFQIKDVTDTTFTDVNHSRRTYRSATATSDFQDLKVFQTVLRITGSESITNGTLASWDSARDFQWTARAYTTAYEIRLHTTNHWDGAGTDIVVPPMIEIIAIA